jgi:hypothetical protein
VAIQFWMFCYLPLIPLKTWIVTSERRHGMSGAFTGLPTGFSIKSYIVAWWRTLLGGLLTIFAMASLTMACVCWAGDSRITPGLIKQNLAITAILSALLFLPYWIPGIGRATTSRAAELRAALSDRPASSADDHVHAHF